MDLRNSKILVTGGAGFVGSYVVEKLLELSPRQIIIIDNLLRGSHENMQGFIRNPRVEFIEGDIRDFKLMDSMMKNVDYCFHLAALRITRCAENPVEGFEVMVNAVQMLAELIKKHQVKKLIYSSSASIYGMARNFPTPESDPPYDNSTLYGAAKLFGEQLLRSYHTMYGVNWVGLRYFNIYGPRMDREGKYTEVMIRWLECIREKRNPIIFGDGSTSMDLIYIEDVATANIQALLSDVTNESFNIGSQTETSLAQLLQLLLKIHDVNLKIEYQKERSVNSVKRRLADISSAKQKLAFSPQVSVEEGLRRLSNWYFVD